MLTVDPESLGDAHRLEGGRLHRDLALVDAVRLRVACVQVDVAQISLLHLRGWFGSKGKQNVHVNGI